MQQGRPLCTIMVGGCTESSDDVVFALTAKANASSDVFTAGDLATIMLLSS